MDLKIIRKIIRDSIRIDRVSYAKSPVLTVAHDNDRSLERHGRYYSPLMDTIEDDLAARGMRCQSVARIISTIKGDRAYGNVVSPEGGFARALLSKRVKGVLQRGRYPYSGAEERVWGDILDATGARKVLAILPSRELCTACHARGVWVADVQHGVIADSHPWYGYEFRKDDPVAWVPDAFLCWDQGSADVIEKWSGAKGSHVLLYGSRWVSRFLNPRADDALVEELLAANRAQIDALGDKPTIVVSFSWGVYNIPNGLMVDSLADAIRATSDRYNWLLRLHPNQLIGFAKDESENFFSYFDKRLRGHATWEWATRTALPIVLSASDVHLSWNSSVAMEAAQMGIRTAMLDPDLRGETFREDYYRYYHESGMISYIPEDQASIEHWLEANVGSKGRPESFDLYDANYAQLLDFLLDPEPAPAAGTRDVAPAFVMRPR